MLNASSLLLDGLDDDRVAVVRGRQSTTAAQLHERALGLASWLIERGVAPGDRVVMLVPPGPEFAAALLAAVRVGAAPVLMETTQAPGAWLARVSACAPRFVIADPKVAVAWATPGLPALLRAFGLPLPPPLAGVPVLRLPRVARGEGPLVLRDADDEALILFTSGTTSAPRAVVHSHGNLPQFLAHVRAVAEGLECRSYLAETPQQIFYALLMRSTCYLVAGQGERRVKRTLALLERQPIEAWFGSPWTWQSWLSRGLPLPEGLRSVLLGSSPVTRPFLRRLLERLGPEVALRCIYGLTEAGPVCCVDGREKVELKGEGDPMGPPLPGVSLRVVDGEVQVSSPAVAHSYLGEAPLGPWLPTGDLGCIEADGLWLRGRRKDMILRRGVNLYPGVLEPLLADEVDECALVGVYDGAREDERVVLAWVGASPPALAGRLGDAEPDHLLRLEALPRSGRQHKVDKAALRELARARFEIPE